MYITKEIYNKIILDTPKPPPETGGILGAENGIISHYAFVTGEVSRKSNQYNPDTKVMNNIISIWIENGIDLIGVFHSHPKGDEELSDADLKYIDKIMKSICDYTDKLYFPLVIAKEKIICNYALIVAGEIKIFHDAFQLI